MENRYKIILSNDHIYKEIELAPNAQRVKVGTNVDCDIRLRKELFFEQIELTFLKNGKMWSVQCSDGLYLTVGDIRKLVTKTLTHGESLQVKYQESNIFVFSLDFFIDFDDGKRKYERIVDVAKSTTISIGCAANSNLRLSSAFVKDDEIVLNKSGNDYTIDIKRTTYGAYINGKKAKNGDVIHNGDFLSVSDYFFYIKDGKIWAEIRSDLSVNSLGYVDRPSNPRYPKFKRNTRIKSVLNKDPIEILDPPAKPQKAKNNIFLQLLPSLGMLVTSGLMATMGGAMILFSVVSGGIAILTTVLTYRENKKEYQKNVDDRLETYLSYFEYIR